MSQSQQNKLEGVHFFLCDSIPGLFRSWKIPGTQNPDFSQILIEIAQILPIIPKITPF
jgi:hypothetical protein